MKINHLLSVLILTFNSVAYANNNLDLFMEGCHLDDPIPTPNEWNALYVTNNNKGSLVKLLKAELLISKKLAGVDGLYDYCVKVKTHATEGSYAKPLTLIKGSNLLTGAINSATISKHSFKEHENRLFIGEENIPETDERIKIVLGDSEYILRQITNLDDNFLGNNHILTLYHKGFSQVIFDERGNYEGETGFYIIWAGDIDNDNKLDLIVNLPESYAAPYHLRLFLSSYAKSGRLVQQVVERGFSSP